MENMFAVAWQKKKQCSQITHSFCTSAWSLLISFAKKEKNVVLLHTLRRKSDLFSLYRMRADINWYMHSFKYPFFLNTYEYKLSYNLIRYKNDYLLDFRPNYREPSTFYVKLNTKYQTIIEHCVGECGNRLQLTFKSTRPASIGEMELNRC